MPDPLGLKLDPDTERMLVAHMQEEEARGRFSRAQGSLLHIDEHRSADLANRLKDRLGRYVDFDQGGLRVLEVDVHGQKGQLTLVPGWDASRPDVSGKKFGGPTVMLKFTIRW